jgi:hemolysin D
VLLRRTVLIEEQRRQTLERFDETSLRCLDLALELRKAEQRAAEQRLRAPIAGRLQHLVRLTDGGVVTAGQAVMEIVPAGAGMEFTGKLPNREIGHLRLGQSVALKLDAFPYTEWGLIQGKLTYIAPGAVIDEKLGAVFTVRAEFDALPPPMRAAGIALIPGMTGSMDIKTGSRSVMAYLLSPLERAAHESMHER